MNDSNGRKIEIGDVLFYTERPHSNYYDAFYEVTGLKGDTILYKELVVNNEGRYIESKFSGIGELSQNNIVSILISSRKHCYFASFLEILYNVKPDQITLDFANRYYPLDRPILKY